MEPAEDPFGRIDHELATASSMLGEKVHAIVVDFHCEATGEKQAADRFCDGRASLVAGTHTHTPSEKGGVDSPTYLTVHEGNGCVYSNSEVFGWNDGTGEPGQLSAPLVESKYSDPFPARALKIWGVARDGANDRKRSFVMRPRSSRSLRGMGFLPMIVKPEGMAARPGRAAFFRSIDHAPSKGLATTRQQFPGLTLPGWRRPFATGAA